jgi:hypothetical protein
MSRISIVIGIMLGCTVIGGSVSAQTFTAYNLALPVAGNQQFASTIGQAFTVNSPIIVSSLGAFDAAIPSTNTAHTLNGTIVTSIYNTVTQQVVTGLTDTFTASSPGTLSGGYLYKTVGGLNGVVLPAGNYVIAWTSITDNDQDGNSLLSGFTAPTYNNGNNLITINTTQFQYNPLNSPYLGADRYPINTLSGQLDAGTFTYTANTPEPGTVSLFGSLIVVAGGAIVRRRRLRKKTA